MFGRTPSPSWCPGSSGYILGKLLAPDARHRLRNVNRCSSTHAYTRIVTNSTPRASPPNAQPAIATSLPRVLLPEVKVRTEPFEGRRDAAAPPSPRAVGLGGVPRRSLGPEEARARRKRPRE
eukprot:39964-Prorocentrum_minimum.AAC.1